jgi:hypothetical protein
MSELNLHFVFPNDDAKERFKRDFYSWHKTYERSLEREGAQQSGGGGQPSGLQQGQAESYGFPSGSQPGGSQAGLFRFPWGGYVDIIPGW